MSNNTNPCKADVSEANTGIDTRRQIESMTLGEIKEAKSRLADRINEAINREVKQFSEEYNWGSIAVNVETEIRRCNFDGIYLSDRNAPRHVTRTITIKSDLEEDE